MRALGRAANPVLGLGAEPEALEGAVLNHANEYCRIRRTAHPFGNRLALPDREAGAWFRPRHHPPSERAAVKPTEGPRRWITRYKRDRDEPTAYHQRKPRYQALHRELQPNLRGELDHPIDLEASGGERLKPLTNSNLVFAILSSRHRNARRISIVLNPFGVVYPIEHSFPNLV